MPRILPKLVLLLLVTSTLYAQSRFRLSGHIRDGRTDAPIVRANILILDTGFGTTTDSTGFYALPLPKGLQTVQITHQSYETAQRNLTANRDQSLTVLLNERVTLLRETIITANGPGEQVRSNVGGVTTLSVRTLKQLPTLLGEVDLIRSIQLLPGVSSVGEGSTGFNVRGGNTDQNLILIDDAPLFNASHLLGFMSVFNPDVVQDVALYRGSVPAMYGGRAASVLQTRLKDATATQLSVSGGLGLLSSRLKIETPLVKNKLAMYGAGRFSYVNQLLQLFPVKAITGIRAGFSDYVGRVNYAPNAKNKLTLTGFSSNDQFRFPADTLSQVDLGGAQSAFDWTTRMASLGWFRYLSDRWQLQTSGVWSRYRSTISNPDSTRAYALTSGIDYRQLKMALSYVSGTKSGRAWPGRAAPGQAWPRLSAEMGLSSIWYDVVAGQLEPTDPRSQVNPVHLPNEKAVEAGAFANADIALTKQLSVQAGLRYSWFGQFGPVTTYTYRDGFRSPETLRDSVLTDPGTVAKTYSGLEPRLSVRLRLGEHASVKLGAGRMIQYLQQLSNTAAALPADRWKVADAHLKPAIADQVSLGYFQDFRNTALEVSVEVFYKRLTNVNDFKGGTTLLLNRYPETALLQGTGFARGLELYIRKSAGLLTGWISYTYSQTRFRIVGNTPETTVNRGNYYPAPYDKPHILNVILNYKLGSRVSVSVNGVYSSGRPITYPVGKLYVGGRIVPFYLDRNQSRIPDYLRFDMGLTINGLKGSGQRNAKRRYESDWSISAYNVLSRRNAYSVFVQTPTRFAEYYNRVNAYKLSVLGSVIPSVTYNFRF